MNFNNLEYAIPQSMASSLHEQAIPVTRRTIQSSVLLRYFFVWVGVLSLFFVVAGFSPTYFIPMASGTYHAKPLYHIHGAMYFLWILLIITQPLLVRMRFTNMHRRIGVFGLILAAGMFIIGVTMAFVAGKANFVKGAGDTALSFLIVSLTDMLLFGTFTALTLLNLRNSEMHKRLILLATLSILPAAFGRIIGIYQLNSLLGFFIQESLLILGIGYDLYVRKGIHPVYIWGGSAVVIIHLVRIPLGETEAWMAFANWVMN
jgi:hypothetical protein